MTVFDAYLLNMQSVKGIRGIDKAEHFLSSISKLSAVGYRKVV